eukprot:6095053-Pyramimonas_sp.AAC.1
MLYVDVKLRFLTGACRPRHLSNCLVSRRPTDRGDSCYVAKLLETSASLFGSTDAEEPKYILIGTLFCSSVTSRGSLSY